MMHPSTMKLVDRLCAMTAQGKIDWAQGETADSLVYNTEGYSVILHGEPTNIQLTDSSGVELEKVTAADLSQTPHADGRTYEAVVATLLTDAKRVALGTETAINTVLQGLDLDGDGVVDIPMEDGLVPTPAEIADHEPDMAEDTADESGVASLADADVTDVSNAVASLADEVNQTEAGTITSDAADPVQTIEETVQTGDAPQEKPASITAQATGLTMAGLGAAGLLKAAQQKPADEPVETVLPDMETLPEPDPALLEETALPQENGFNLSSTETSAAPLQLNTDADEPEPASDAPDADDGSFVPPQPGQFLSLSGLAKDASKDTPVMAGTATTMVGANPTNPQMPEPMEIAPKSDRPIPVTHPPAPAPIEQAAPVEAEIPVAPSAPVQDTEIAVEAEPVPEPEVEVQPEADPEPAQEAPRPSRFNPWI